jgi:hypothetical protein|tara:strand:+ start:685 stop:987 length:303 start_codon:yes stop_codon:yes gene_type:complete
MAKKYVNINSATTELLASTMRQTNGDIKSINIANTNISTASIISLYLDDLNSANDYYFFKNVNLPAGASLFLDKDLSFDVSKYTLKLDASGTTNLTVIIT